MKFFIAAWLALSASACTPRQIYEFGQQTAGYGCRNLPEHEYQECADKHKKSYHEYQSERKAAMQY